jgi:hypothetical protein
MGRRSLFLVLSILYTTLAVLASAKSYAPSFRKIRTSPTPVCMCADSDDETSTPKAAGGSRKGPPPETIARIAVDRQRHLRTWHGTQIRPAKTASGDELQLQQAIVGAFLRDDPLPEQRFKAFESYFFQPTISVAGWYGAVENVAPSSDGCIVDVRVTPRLVSTRAAVLVTGEYRVETWRYDGNDLVFVKMGEAPKDSKPLRSF